MMLLSEIATKIQAQLIGDGQQDITGVNAIADASCSEICFLTSAKYAKTLDQSVAAGHLPSMLKRSTRVSLPAYSWIPRSTTAAWPNWWSKMLTRR
ncbi:MAG: hypothetical protein ACYTFP_07250 [Planctomycetota bacterium]|jgi:UDP-3-O-[3-hydroxymyristoyl] glucosamine N-acyltransferase